MDIIQQDAKKKNFLRLFTDLKYNKKPQILHSIYI